MRSAWVATATFAAIAFVGSFWSVVAQGTRTVADGVYTSAQAARGKTIYDMQCRACHGATLGGGLAPPLSGAAFLAVWGRSSVADLVDKIHHTMPQNNPGTLSREQATDIVAHVLNTNGFRTGTAELKADDSVKQIALAAPGTVIAASAAPATASQALASARPEANLAQIMRGILFPSSNLIFNVQNNDPGEQKVGWQPGTSDFSWVNWGAGIYSGWELVDYAAMAITESAPLLVMPGRRCENGRPVPVDRADWIEFTNKMAEAGRVAYKASQSRNRDAVIDATNVIADSCLNCHDKYRDKPGGTDADPSNKVARCY
jgi:mono/diheme cytochrome c family protein